VGRIPRGREFQRPQGAGRIQVDHRVELICEQSFEVVADPLGLGAIDHADRPFEERSIHRLLQGRVVQVQRLENGNTLITFGADIDPTTLKAKTPQTFTLVEADANPEAGALAVLDMLIPGNMVVYRALPVKELFGERF